MTAATVRPRWVRALETLLFAHRSGLRLLFIGLTLVLLTQALQLRVDAAYDRSWPQRSPVIAAERAQRMADTGDNPVRIAMIRTRGTIWDRAFLVRLKALTDGVAQLPGVDRRRIRSLFANAPRLLLVEESSYASADVLDAAADPAAFTDEDIARLRERVIAGGLLGRLVSDDQRAALIELAWPARDPVSGAAFDQRALAPALREVARAAEAAGGGSYTVHLLGAPVLAEALELEAPTVLAFAALTTLVVAALLLFGLTSGRLTAVTLLAAAVVVIWTLGLLRLGGQPLDPDAIGALAIVAIASLLAASQFGLCWQAQAAAAGSPGFDASLAAWRATAAPLAGATLAAIAANAAIAVLLDIPLARQIAGTTTLGLALMLPIVLLGVPLALSGIRTQSVRWQLADALDARLTLLAALARPAVGLALLIAVGALSGVGAWFLRDQPLAPAGAELARLSADNAVRRDAGRVAAAFPATAFGLRVELRAGAPVCTDPAALAAADQLVWRLDNLPAVAATTALPAELKRVLGAFGDGSPKFRVLGASAETLTQAIAPIGPDRGLYRNDCKRLPIGLRLARRDAPTLAEVATTVAQFNAEQRAAFRAAHPQREPDACATATPETETAPDCPITAEIAGGPLGIALARQQTLRHTRLLAPLVVIGVLALVLQGLLRDLRVVAAVVLSLAFAGWVAMGGIAASGAALTALTLPLWLAAVTVAAGAYLLPVLSLRRGVASGLPLRSALRTALLDHGRPLLVLLVVAIGFALWIVSGFPAQRGAGKLLAVTAAALGLVGFSVLPAVSALLLADPADARRC